MGDVRGIERQYKIITVGKKEIILGRILGLPGCIT